MSANPLSILSFTLNMWLLRKNVSLDNCVYMSLDINGMPHSLVLVTHSCISCYIIRQLFFYYIVLVM